MFPLRALRVVRIAVCLLPVETKALEFNTRGNSYLTTKKVGGTGVCNGNPGRTHRGKSQGGDFRLYCWDHRGSGQLPPGSP